jgi:hypothetical protein
MTTLLRYDLTTDPFPLQASPSSTQALGITADPPFSVCAEADIAAADTTDDNAFETMNTIAFAAAPAVATLTVVASNPSADPVKNPVTVQGLSVTLPVGPNASDLTSDATGIGPVAPAGWVLKDTKPGSGTVEYVFAPQAGQGVIGKQGLSFVFNNVTTNTQEGTCQITIKEGSTGNPTKALFATKFPSGWGTVSFWLDPANVPFLGSTTLHWSGPAKATYTIQYALDGQVINLPAEGDPPLGSEGQYPAQSDPPLVLDQTTIFTINVDETISGQQYHAQEQKTASVQVPAPTISFSANPSILNANNPSSVQLEWTTSNASEISIENVGNYTGSQVVSGNTNVSPAVTPPVSNFTYFATAYGLTGYSGPPALAQANVEFMWSAASSWCDVWNGSAGNFWSLEAGQYHALDLSLVVTDNPSGEYREVYANLPAGVQAANLGTQQINTPNSEIASANFGASLPSSRLYVGIGEYDTEQTDNVSQTWALKFPDGRILLLWYASGNSDGEYIFSDKWQFTFGWTYYTPPSQ